MILNQSQAKAVYDAMCTLNNVSAKAKVMFGSVHTQGVNVFEDSTGVHVAQVDHYSVTWSEFYPTQAAFAAAYGIDGKQPRVAVYTPGIGWQVQDQNGRRGNYETEAQALES